VFRSSRSGGDDLVAMMLVQLLRHAGYEAHQLESGAVEEMLAAASRRENSIVCVSSLLPFFFPLPSRRHALSAGGCRRVIPREK
jgi:hypothetical protein